MAPVHQRRVHRGLSVAYRYLGTKYGYWRPGKKLHVKRLPTRRQMLRLRAVCSDVPNVMKLANGQRPPGGRYALQGGTLAWGRRYGHRSRRHRLGQWVPKGTLFIIPFSGNALRNQGHVWIAQESGTNPRCIQSGPKRGWHRGVRLFRCRRAVWAVWPNVWLNR